MKKLIYLAAVAAITLFGCTGKDGAPGAQGPAGANGTNGTNGTNGAANVTTTTYTATPGNWNASGAWWTIDVPVSSLTDADKDVVMVYVKISGEYWAMPSKDLYYTGDNYQFAYVTGTVSLWYYYTSAPSVTWDFKIVVIPPAQRLANPNVNLNNYNEVKTAFNLKD